MSKVLDMVVPDVVDYCANEECGSEIVMGQPVIKVGHELVCSPRCLMKKLEVVPVIAGIDSAG